MMFWVRQYYAYLLQLCHFAREYITPKANTHPTTSSVGHANQGTPLVVTPKNTVVDDDDCNN